MSLNKERHTSKFSQLFLSKFTEEQKELLVKQMESRLDDKLRFFIRLDKPKLLEGEDWITDKGNCFHFTFAIAAYPHKREVAKRIIKRSLQ